MLADDGLLSAFIRQSGEWAGSGSPREVFSRAAEFFGGRLPVDLIVIGGIDSDRLDLSLWSVAEGTIEALQGVSVGLDDPRAIAGAVRKKGLVRFVGSQVGGRSFSGQASWVVAVPLLVGGRVVGSIGLEGGLRWAGLVVREREVKRARLK